MFNVMIRVVIIYLVVIGIMRLMGKRQIGELEPFELVITLIIADLATIPMAEATIPIWYGIVPLIMISVIHFLFALISKQSPFMRDIISGKPVVVIDPNGIDFDELKKLNISTEELMEQIRNLDYFDLSDVNYAIIERNGKLTIIPKTQAMPVTRYDMKIVKPENEIFYCIVENGRVLHKNFKEMGLHHDVVMRDILHNMVCNKRDIVFCSLSEGGDVYIQKRGENSKNFKIKLTENHYIAAELAEMRKHGEAI